MSVTNEEVPGSGGGSNNSGTAATAATTPANNVATTNNVSGSSAGSNSVSSPTGSSTSGHGGLLSLHHRSSHNVSSNNHRASADDVVKCGNLRKLKGKKKFFVLRKESSNGAEGVKPARLEYYANEKKFNLGHPPKKSIVLKHCFNINRTESKVKYAVALHTHNDCVRIAFSSEEEMNDWLRLMNSLSGDEDEDGAADLEENSTASGKPFFEHVWLVQAFNKGLGSQEGILGSYRLCLTSKELTLLKVGDHDDKNSVLKFPLPVIRNVSHDAIGCFFHIEFGRLACTGAGKLSLKTEDNNIAQNMHLLILKAMQNYQKDDLIPRDTSTILSSQRTGRSRTSTWSQNMSTDDGSSYTATTRSGSFRNTPPGGGMPRIRSVDSSISRLRSESISSTSTIENDRRLASGMSPPVPVPPTPTSAYKMMMLNNSAMGGGGGVNNVSSTDSANSASSSYSMDYENNNNNSSGNYSKSIGDEEEDIVGDESYVPWNPISSDEGVNGHHNHHNLHLPIHHQSSDMSDYVETSVGIMNGTPSSSTADVQSPLSPYDNYIPMSPAGAMMGGSGGGRSSGVGGKISVSHSRNSSLIEDHDGYVPMIPGGSLHQHHPHHPVHHLHQHSRSDAGSNAGSTSGLDDSSYLDMDFSRKLNLSNDDKVSSYFQSSDDFDDGSICMRPVRAYSVGSRSDTGCSSGKNRFGKNRLEAVQEAHRTRAMSVGSRQTPLRRPVINPASSSTGITASISSAIFNGLSSSRNVHHHGSHQGGGGGGGSTTPLSSSWSGSTGGRWLPPKIHPPSSQQPPYPTPSHTHQDSGDSDLMELDFSHNKSKSRKRSLPGPTTAAASSVTTTTSNLSSGSSSMGSTKLSPAARSILANNIDSTPPSSIVEIPGAELATAPKNCANNILSSPAINTVPPRYPTSAPISISCSKNNNNIATNSNASAVDCATSGGFIDPSNSILKRMTGLDLKKLKELDDEGAYLPMDFSPAPPPPAVVPKVATTTTTMTTNSKGPEGKPPLGQTPLVIKATDKVTSATFPSHPAATSLSRSLSVGSNISTTSSNNSNSSSSSSLVVKTQAPSVSERVVPTTLAIPPPSSTAPSSLSSPTAGTNNSSSMSTLSRIEESPEKVNHFLVSPFTSNNTAIPTQQRLTYDPTRKSSLDDPVTYTAIQHFPTNNATAPLTAATATTLSRHSSFPSDISKKLLLVTSQQQQQAAVGAAVPAPSLALPTSCAKQSQQMINGTSKINPNGSTNPPTTTTGRVTYAQVEFIKNNSEVVEVKRN